MLPLGVAMRLREAVRLHRGHTLGCPEGAACGMHSHEPVDKGRKRRRRRRGGEGRGEEGERRGREGGGGRGGDEHE